MDKRKKPKGKPAAPAGNQALTLAKLLGTPDPVLQVQGVQQLLALGAAPVFTLVIQVDSRAPEGTVFVSNIGPALTAPIAHMMLAAASRKLAEQSAMQPAGPAAPPADPPAGKPPGRKGP